MDERLVDKLIREQRKLCDEPELQIGDLVKVNYSQLDTKKDIVQIIGWYVGARASTYNRLIFIKSHNFSPTQVQKVIQPFLQLVQKVDLWLTDKENLSGYNLKTIYTIPEAGFKWVNESSNLVILSTEDLRFEETESFTTLKDEYFHLHP